MDTNLIISSMTATGKKGSKAISNINPEKDNSTLKTFAQMVNGLTTNTYVDATRVDKQSVNEEGGGGSGKTEGIITYDAATHTITYNGDADELLVFHLQEESTANQASGIYEMNLLDPTNPAYLQDELLSVGDILVTPATDNFTAAFFEYEE